PRRLRLAEQLKQLAVRQLCEGTVRRPSAEWRIVRDAPTPLRSRPLLEDEAELIAAIHRPAAGGTDLPAIAVYRQDAAGHGPLRLRRGGDRDFAPQLPGVGRVRRERLEPSLEFDLFGEARGLGAVRHLGRTLGEFDEQPRVLRVAEQPDTLAARFGELAQLTQRVDVLGLVLAGHAHARSGQDFRHAHTAPSGNSCNSFFTSARNLSASAPSTTR